MCSVVGFIGNSHSRSKVIRGLERLEYRGYDSAGYACIDDYSGEIEFVKSAGGIDQLVHRFAQMPIDGYVGIGHTRWSTHGESTEDNAHPHFNCDRSVAVVHNGIIENHIELRRDLVDRGHSFSSETDTEVVAHLFEHLLAGDLDLVSVCCELVSLLEGAYALLFLLKAHPKELVAFRRKSPLCIGIGQDGSYVASDQLAFADHVQQVVFMPEDSFAVVSSHGLDLYDFKGNKREAHYLPATVSWEANTKKGHAHYMLKEMYEQKDVVLRTTEQLNDLGAAFFAQMNMSSDDIRGINRIIFLGCGTSYNAGRIGCYFFETIAKIQVEAHLASEYRFSPIPQDDDLLYIALSQSGETADTLEVVRMLKQHKKRVIVISNVASSSLVREADGFLLTYAGQEIAVASTKSFSAQIAVLFWLAHKCAFERNLLTIQQFSLIQSDFVSVADQLEIVLEKYKEYVRMSVAPLYAHYKNFIFLGRGISYAFALEAALKMREIAYIFVDCYPSGELKHGPIALVDAQTPVWLFSVVDPVLYQKLVANAQEVKARSGHLIVFAFEWQHELIDLADTVFIVPKVSNLLVPLVMTPLMQYIVYEIALTLNRPIDKPRNLAKSVTVE